VERTHVGFREFVAPNVICSHLHDPTTIWSAYNSRSRLASVALFCGIDHCYLGIRYKTPNADWCAQDALFAMFIRSPSMRNQVLSENVARNAVLIHMSVKCHASRRCEETYVGRRVELQVLVKVRDLSNLGL
jgi:hypothetical protein